MSDTDQLWMDSYGFVYSADGKRLLKGANVEGAYWIPEGVEEIEEGALIGCKIGTLHVPWTAHVHEHDQLVFSENEEENEIQMPPVYFWTKAYSCRDDETWAFEDEGEYRVDEKGVGYSLDGHRLLFVRHTFSFLSLLPLMEILNADSNPQAKFLVEPSHHPSEPKAVTKEKILILPLNGLDVMMNHFVYQDFT